MPAAVPARLLIASSLLPVYQLRSQPPPAPASPWPPLGQAQQTDSGGARLTVTVTKLTDPLLDSGAALLPATRAVAVFVEIANAGPATYDSSASGDFSVIASTGAVTPAFAPQGVCQTPLRDFENDIYAGGGGSGCIAFSVATGARILAVRFSPHAASPGSRTWLVSP